ncbi:unnamed protein product, partial [Prorocentrum cordatum]
VEVHIFLGNARADFFARIGADAHAAAQTLEKVQSSVIFQTRLTFDFLSRFAQSI